MHYAVHQVGGFVLGNTYEQLNLQAFSSTVALVRDDEIRRRLRERNPWWRLATGDRLAWVDSDETLREAAQHDLGFRSSVLDDVEPGGLYVLRGPRRVGKSVVIKRLIQRLLSEGVDVSRIVYLALNDFSTQDLRRALTLGREVTAHGGDDPRYWIFDEITAVPGWTAVLKDARDETPIRRDTVVVTGSSAHDLTEAERDLGAGRVGSVLNPFRLLLPMSFADVVRLRFPALPTLPETPLYGLQGPSVAAALRQLDPFVDEFDLAWQAYLEHGGFPRAVAEFARNGTVGTSFARDLRAWLAPDVTADEPADAVLLLLSLVGRRMTSPMDVSNTARELGLGRTALSTRIHRLRATMAAFPCPQIEADGTWRQRAQAKLYLIDPLLCELPAILDVGLAVADAPAKSEAALAVHVARAVNRVHPERFLEGRAAGYLRTTRRKRDRLRARPDADRRGACPHRPDREQVGLRRLEGRGARHRRVAGARDRGDEEHPRPRASGLGSSSAARSDAARIGPSAVPWPHGDDPWPCGIRSISRTPHAAGTSPPAPRCTRRRRSPRPPATA